MTDKKTEKLFNRAVTAVRQEKAKNAPHFTNQPLAAKGLKSFRYKGRYGYIMIGAANNADALREAKRSTDSTVTIDKLEAWDGTAYVPAAALGSKLPSPRSVEKMFGLQEGETYDYEDEAHTDLGSVMLGKYKGEVIQNENTSSCTVWVKGIGNVGFGYSKKEAIADARKNIAAKAAKAALGIDQSTITSHNTKSSQSKYKGKIKPADLHEMQSRLAQFLAHNNTTLKQLEAKYLASGFTPTRFRWDLFNAAIAKPYDLLDRIYTYADDSHIDTALRHLTGHSR